MGAPTAAFERPCSVPLIAEKPLERDEQERAESPLFRGRGMEVSLFQQPRKKLLGEVLRVVRVATLSPHIRIERIPIGAAEQLHRLGACRRRLVLRRQDKRPVRRVKPRRGRTRFLGWLARLRHADQNSHFGDGRRPMPEIPYIVTGTRELRIWGSLLLNLSNIRAC